MNAAPALAFDHFVVAAATLDEGLAWCEATLGHRPEAGGTHPLMATHNRVFAVGSPDFPRAYGEILAIDPNAASPLRPRWFGLDEPALQAALARGPLLVAWVARCADAATALAACRAVGIDPGEIVAASRETPQGRLHWRITVRADGRRLCEGALPTVIEWGEKHPSATLPLSGISLRSVSVSGVPVPVEDWVGAAVAIDRAAAAPALRVVLDTPRGRIALESIQEER